MSKKLYTPGPSNVPQNIRVQLAKDIIHHRMKDYHKVFYKVNDKLKRVFKTTKHVLTITSSGTGVMESSVVNLFSKNDEVLVINTGNFGQRFIDICKVYGLKTHHLDYKWGSTFVMDDVRSMFANYPHIKGVFVTFHETSTGVVNNLKDLGEFVSDTDALLIADCISGLIVHPFEFDKWNVDCAVAASQKGFNLPPGLAFVALSDKAIDRLPHSNLPRFYFDYQKYIDYFKKGENPFTPAISLVIALDIALNEILEIGIDSIVETKYELRVYTEKKFQELGFKLFIDDETIRGNVLIPVIKNNDMTFDLDTLVNFLDERYNLQVSKGQGKYVNQMLRVGIISEFTNEDIDELVDKVTEFIDKGE